MFVIPLWVIETATVEGKPVRSSSDEQRTEGSLYLAYNAEDELSQEGWRDLPKSQKGSDVFNQIKHTPQI